MDYNLSKIYEILTDGGILEDVKSGESVDIKGNIAGFPIPKGGIITYLSQNGKEPELKIEYGVAVIEIGKNGMKKSKGSEAMEPLVNFLDGAIAGELNVD